MKFGFVFPGGTPQEAIEFAKEAETYGWDGFFVWEPVYGIDPWVTLGGIAAQTQRIKIGTLLTPPSRRRPWKLASEALTVDLLSGGRMILSVGMGAVDTGFESMGEITDRKNRAELLDESIDILTGLWGGQPFIYEGKHYQLDEFTFVHQPPAPVQQPRIPIWVVGAWGWPRSMQRVLKCDGILPTIINKNRAFIDLTPDHIRQIKAFVDDNRQLDSPFDIIVENTSPGDDHSTAVAKVQSWVDAGATWWIESMWTETDSEKWHYRIRQGPPKFG
jgi:alkanesulfonate monooxygenase SsuD/methylene tetrahydromethanopterin reductase-like flavin-dependent oxidoreductase (luciferase family)